MERRTMEFRDNIYIFIAVMVNIVATYAALVVGPSPVEGLDGDVYRTFYIHTPTAWICYLALGLSLLASILFLARRSDAYDLLAEVSAGLGIIYGMMALITGSIWANAVWGVSWNWDPRETTTLILWLAYVGYVALRLSIGNPAKRAVTSAVYNILAFSTIPLSYLSIRLWQSLHPQIIVPGSGISATASVMETLFLNLIAGTLVFLFLLKTAYETRVAQKRIGSLIHKEGGIRYGS